jgi:tight adherence protein B
MGEWLSPTGRHLMIGVFVFAGVALGVEGLLNLLEVWRGPEARRHRRRLAAMRQSLPGPLQSVLRPLPGAQGGRGAWVVPGLSRLSGLVAGLLAQAGWAPRVRLFGLVSAGLGWCAWAGSRFLLAVPPRIDALAALAGLLVPLGVLLWRRRRRLRHLDRQLPDALDFIARALRAGHAFQVGLRLAGQQMPSPIGPELAASHDEVNFGVPLPQALANLARRMPGDDLRFFVAAVVMHRESGGNLTGLMSNLSALIRARLKLAATVRTLSAEGRLSAWILGLLPFGLAGILAWANPEFIGVLWQDPVGIRMSQTLLVLMAIGAWWLWRITRIRI